MIKLRVAFKAAKIIKNFPTYLLSSFGWIKRPIIIYELRKGIKIACRNNTTDRLILNEIILYDVYNLYKKQVIKKEDIIVDIGAHIGVFSVLAAKMARNGKVYSFEPFKETYKILEKNKKINNLKNLLVFKKAISNKKEKSILYFNNSDFSTNSLIKQDNMKEVLIECMRLEEVFKENSLKKIDFLKMDCEGSEYEILFNCSEDLLKKIKRLGLEYHDLDEKRNHRTLKEFLLKKGFKVKISKSSPRFGMIYAVNKK